MNADQAEVVVDLIQHAWTWVMEPETFRVWKQAMQGLEDQESAEVAVVNLVKFQDRRPSIAAVIDAYKSERQADLKTRPTWLLAGPPVPGMPASVNEAWSVEGARWAMGFRLEDELSVERNRRSFLIEWFGHERAGKLHAETWPKIRGTLVSREQAAAAEEAAKQNWLSLGETREERISVLKGTLKEVATLEA